VATFIGISNSRTSGKFFEEKEIRVYYKFINSNFVLLTVKARYGKFSTKGGTKE